MLMWFDEYSGFWKEFKNNDKRTFFDPFTCKEKVKIIEDLPYVYLGKPIDYEVNFEENKKVVEDIKKLKKQYKSHQRYKTNANTSFCGCSSKVEFMKKYKIANAVLYRILDYMKRKQIEINKDNLLTIRQQRLEQVKKRQK